MGLEISKNMLSTQTLIFLDFETTGLTNDGNNDPLFNPTKTNETPGERMRRLETILRLDSQNMPRLTEMSLISVPRQLFVEAAKKMRSGLSTLTGRDEQQQAFEYVPVSINVHTRQMNPNLSQQQWAIYEESRKINPCIQLAKSDLEWKNKFAVEWPGIVQFLEVCPKPACLIAHNGVRFDFRLLFHELRRAKASGAELQPIPDNVFFLDSLSTFMDIEMNYHREMELTMQNIDWNFVFSQANRRIDLCEEEEVVRRTAESNATTVHSTTTTTQVEMGDESNEQIGQKLQRINQLQKTPDGKSQHQQGGSETIRRSAKRTLPFTHNQRNEHEHPMKFMRTQGWSPAKQRRINPKFFMRNSQTGDWTFDGQMARRELLTRGNFRLETLHNRLFPTTPFFNHRAQADCEALLQVCLTYGDDFLSHMDKNAAAFPNCFKTMGFS